MISNLEEVEVMMLNAQEARVLPPEVRIQILVAQESAGENKDAMGMEVERLDNVVRLLAMYALMQARDAEQRGSRRARGKGNQTLSPSRAANLGRKLVMAVRMELQRMYSDIFLAGDVDNDLFDHLCSETFQTAAADGFEGLSVAALLEPGSGYKPLLQLRKDQMLERVAAYGGLKSLAGHDCLASGGSDAVPLPEHESPGSTHLCPEPGRSDEPSRGGSGRGRQRGSDAQPLKTLTVAPLSSPPTRCRDLLVVIDDLMTGPALDAALAESEARLSLVRTLPPLSPMGSPSGASSAPSGGGRRFSEVSLEDDDAAAAAAAAAAASSLPAPMLNLPGGLPPTPPKALPPAARAPFSGGWHPFAAADHCPSMPLAVVIPGDGEGAPAGLAPAAGSPSDFLISEVDWLMAQTRAKLGTPVPADRAQLRARGGGGSTAPPSAAQSDTSSRNATPTGHNGGSNGGLLAERPPLAGVTPRLGSVPVRVPVTLEGKGARAAREAGAERMTRPPTPEAFGPADDVHLVR